MVNGAAFELPGRWFEHCTGPYTCPATATMFQVSSALRRYDRLGGWGGFQWEVLASEENIFLPAALHTQTQTPKVHSIPLCMLIAQW